MVPSDNDRWISHVEISIAGEVLLRLENNLLLNCPARLSGLMILRRASQDLAMNRTRQAATKQGRVNLLDCFDDKAIILRFFARMIKEIEL